MEKQCCKCKKYYEIEPHFTKYKNRIPIKEYIICKQCRINMLFQCAGCGEHFYGFHKHIHDDCDDCD